MPDNEAYPRCSNCGAQGHWMDQCESSRPTPVRRFCTCRDEDGIYRQPCPYGTPCAGSL